MATLPRGIQAANWTTSEGEVKERFRVRITRKTFKADRYFETLAEARDFLFESKTPRGRKRLEADFEKEQRELPAALDLTTMDIQVNLYLDKYFPEAPEPEVTDDSIKSARARLLKLLRVEVSDQSFARKAKTGKLGTLGIFITFPKTAFGKISIHHINEQTVNELIDARLDGMSEVWNENKKCYEDLRPVSKATVVRDIVALRGFWTKLRHFNNFEFHKLEDKQANPFRDCDQRRLKNHDVRRNDRIPESAQKAIFEALAECSNLDMTRIFALALTSGMRRSEVLFLEKEWVDLENAVIELPAEITKTNSSRKVKLTPDAVAVLQTVLEAKKNVSGRLFTYTRSGFNANWQRVKKRITKAHPDLKDVRFHSARREFITSILEKISTPAAGIQFTTIKDIRYLINTFIDKKDEPTLATYEGMLDSVGHKSKQTNLRYISTEKPK